MSLDLEDLEAIERLDGEGVLGVVEAFPEQCREAWELGRAVSGLPDASGIGSIVVLGMGGSGVSGDVVASVVEPRLPIPLRTIKSYGPLPGWVGRHSLVFAVSYSGNTEETLAATEEACARACRVVALSSGGRLADIAAERGLTHVALPGGLHPRASLGYLSLPVLAVLVSMGLVPDLRDDVEEALSVLTTLANRCRRDVRSHENPAKDLAARVHGHVPVIYGSYGLTAAAAYRFKCDLNEYGKTPAFWHFLPELDHNEIVGWNRLSDLTRERFVNVLLRDAGEDPRIALRFEITRALTEGHIKDTIEVASEGTSALARLLSLVLLTQLASIYVGLAYEVDPGPVAAIAELKAELERRMGVESRP